MIQMPSDLPRWRRAALAALRVKVVYTGNAEKLRSGPCILTCNHESLIDGVAIALASPIPLTFAVTPAYAVDNPATARGLAFLSRCGLGSVIPMCQTAPLSLRKLLRVLTHGHSVMIFPTGTIAPGAADMNGYRWLAAKAGCPVLTASISGAGSSRLFAKGANQYRPPITLTI